MQRRDYLTLHGFLEHANPGTDRGVRRGIDDDEGILNTAALIPSTSR